jgi:hypothetical protein
MAKTRYLLYVILLLASLFPSSVALAETTVVNDGPIAINELMSQVRTLIKQDRYKDLEDMASEFRTNKTRFPDGQWKIFHFYEALSKPEKQSGDDWKELFNHHEKWVRAYPYSITAQVALAETWIKYGWDARGHGLSDTLTDEGMRLFRVRVQKAYDILQNMPPTSGDCPQKYRLIMRIALDQGWERRLFENAFKNAVNYEPTYYEYYVAMANYLLPRWYGKEGEWQKFAEVATSYTPKSEGMSAYTRILWGMWLKGVTKGTAFFEETGTSWQMMKQGFQDIEKNYPNSSWNLNYFCLFATLAEIRKRLVAYLHG